MPNYSFAPTDVLDALRAVISEHPDRTNNGACKYVVDGQPNCVAAVVFDRLGVDLLDSDLREMEGQAADSFLRCLVPWANESPVAEALRQVQYQADMGGSTPKGDIPWFDALCGAARQNALLADLIVLLDPDPV